MNVAQDVQVNYLMLLMAYQQMVMIVQQLLHLYSLDFAEIHAQVQVMMVVMLHVQMVLIH
jgi:hypothetical protein